MDKKEVALVGFAVVLSFSLAAFGFYCLVKAAPVHVAPYRVVDEQVKALEVRVSQLEKEKALSKQLIMVLDSVKTELREFTDKNCK